MPESGSSAETILWPRFLADTMLERLARWLRVLGYDVRSAGPAGVTALLPLAAAEQRIILTRNRELAAPGPAGTTVLIEPTAPLAQLREVLAQFRLHPPWRLFTRCLICNTALSPPLEPETQPMSPARPVARPRRQCPECGRVYWEGQHTQRMRAALRQALGTTAPLDT